MLSSAVPGLGGCCRGCSRGPCESVTQPANPTVSVHMHNHGVLPPAGQAVYHVPVNDAYTGHPPAASLGIQVSREVSLSSLFLQGLRTIKSRCTRVS